MKRISSATKCALALAIAALLATGPALAEKGGHHGKGHKEKAEKHEQSEQSDGRGQSKHFESRHGALVSDYYGKHYRKSCPPGLAKKNNGCQPPGQAKKWQMGQALPANVTYHPVPKPLVAQLGQPPAGYRYVRVDSDILLMARVGRTVVDAILNLGRS